MVKFLKPQKAVILLTGRYAGRKAVIVRNYDDGVHGRPYGHAIVCGLAKYPRKVTKKMKEKKLARRTQVKILGLMEQAFLKVVNYQHMMPTRYTLDLDLKALVTGETLENPSKKKEARQEAQKLLEEKFKSGKNRWFFSKLRF